MSWRSHNRSHRDFCRTRRCRPGAIFDRTALGKLVLAKHGPEDTHHVAPEDFTDVLDRIVSSGELRREVFTVEKLGADAVAPVDAIPAPVALVKLSGNDGKYGAMRLVSLYDGC